MEEMMAAFFSAVEEDCRISTSHVSLYMALLALQSRNGEMNYFALDRKSIMKTSKISGLATYHKCIRDLHDYGYISYLPSNNRNIRTRVGLVRLP